MSQIVYFLENSGVEVNIQTISIATLEDVTAILDFQLTSGATFTVLTEGQIINAIRKSTAFTFAVSSPVQSIHYTDIQDNLLVEWLSRIAEAQTVTIVMQETAVTVAR